MALAFCCPSPTRASFQVSESRTSALKCWIYDTCSLNILPQASVRVVVVTRCPITRCPRQGSLNDSGNKRPEKLAARRANHEYFNHHSITFMLRSTRAGGHQKNNPSHFMVRSLAGRRPSEIGPRSRCTSARPRAATVTTTAGRGNWLGYPRGAGKAPPPAHRQFR